MDNYKWPEITTSTPIEELQDIHKHIWDYAIQHGKKPDNPYVGKCAACEYAYVVLKYNSIKNVSALNKCEFCPIKWPDGLKCARQGSLFGKWKATEDPNLAKQIRDVEFRKSNTESISDLKEAIKKIAEIDSQADISQSIYVIEECSELIKELTKSERGEVNKDAIIEEACDVLLTVLVLLTRYEVPYESIKDHIVYKAARTIRIAEQLEVLRYEQPSREACGYLHGTK